MLGPLKITEVSCLMEQKEELPVIPINLSDNSTSKPSYSFKPLWRLPPRLPVFTGRNDQLRKLSNEFSGSNQQILIQQAPQITGTGGVGKSQLAIEFIYRLLEERKVTTVVWLNADTSLSDQLNSEFIQLARALSIDTTLLDKPGLIHAVYRVLNNYPHVLVVLDSATNYSDVQSYMPSTNSPLRFLVTTRDDQVWSNQFAQIPLGVFSLPEAVEYIKRVFSDRVVDDKDAELLANKMGCFPLALAQATGYILTRNIDIPSYISIFDQKKYNRVKLLDKPVIATDIHQETLWLTVNMSFEQLEDPLAQSLLARLAYFAPEAPILSDFISHCTSPDRSAEIIARMRKYGLVSGAIEERQVRLHQMVQEVIRLNHEEAVVKEHLKSIARHLQRYLNVNQDLIEGENKRMVMMVHADSLCSYIQKDFFNTDLKLLELFVLLLRDITLAKIALGRYQEALQIAKTAEEFLVRLPNVENDYKIVIYNILGVSYELVGEVQKALQYYELIMELTEHNRNSQLDPYTTILNVAASVVRLGNPKKAKAVLNKVYEELSSKDNPRERVYLKEAFLIMGGIYRELGEDVKGRDLLQRALDLSRSIYGNNHPKVALVTASVVSSYLSSKGNIDDEYFRMIHDSLSIIEERFGKNHLEVATVLGVMGEVYHIRGDPKRAQEIFQRALKIKVETFSENHPEVALTKFDLARVELVLGNTEAAEELLKSALETQQRFYGNYSKAAGRTLHMIGNTYHDQGDFDKAIKSMNEAIAILSKIYRPMHPTVAQVYNHLSCVYSDKGKFDLAMKFAEKAMEAFTALYGDDHVQVAAALNSLAGILARQGQVRAAIIPMERAIKIYRTVCGAKHFNIAGPLGNLALLYSEIQENTRAKEAAVEALEILSAHLGTEDHPSVAIVQLNLAKICIASKEYDQASQFCSTALNCFSRRLGNNHPSTVEASRLANILRNKPQIVGKSSADWLDELMSMPLSREHLLKLVNYCLQLQQPLLAVQFLACMPDHDNEIKALLVSSYLAMGDIKSAEQCINIKVDTELLGKIKEVRESAMTANARINAWDTNTNLEDDDKIRKAVLLIQVHRYQDAKAVLNSVIQNSASAHHAPAYYQLAKCELRLGNLQAASSHAERSNRLKPHENLVQLIQLIRELERNQPKLQRLVEQYSQLVFNM